MNRVFLFSLIFIVQFFHSQINNNELKYEWIKVKTQMLDGSRCLSESFSSNKFFRLKITDSKICMDSDPISAEGEGCIDYKLDKNLIKTSPVFSFEIVKLTQDSLIIVEKTKNIEENDKIKKHWFVKASIVRDGFLKTHRNDSIIIATEKFTPTIKENFAVNIHSNFNKKGKYPQFVLMGNLVFFPKKEKLELEILNTDDKDIIQNRKNIESIQLLFEQSYKKWNLNDFKRFNKVSIPIIIKSYKEYIGEGWSSKGTPIYYFINNVADISKIYGPNLENIKLSNENFQAGIKAIESQKFEKAINHFNKSYELDDRNIDALYNIINIYSFQKDIKNECKYLKILKNLEQIEASKNFDKKCLE